MRYLCHILETLIKLMSEEECPEYAGVFYLSKARCESTSKNLLDEASNLILAGENFFKAEKKLKSMQVTSIEDFLETGTMCYMYSINLYIDANCFHLALSSGLHLIKILKEFKNYNDAINVFDLILSISSIDFPQHLMVLLDKGLCLIKIRNFKAALKIYIDVLEKMSKNLGQFAMFGQYRTIIEEAEIFRVLLILLCQCQDLKGSIESLSLKDYSLENTGLHCLDKCPILMQINDQVFYHFISLTSTVHNQIHRSAEQVSVELQSHLTDDQNDLVREIVNELINPSGEAF